MAEQSTGRCVHCEETGDQRTVRRCPICFKLFCDEHEFHMSGRAFCSKHCGEFFFFSSDDEDETET